jgi:hypothetical protein
MGIQSQEMTDEQLTFDAALRLSGISLNERDTVLALELARETISNPDFDLRDWAKIDCSVKGESPTQPQPKFVITKVNGKPYGVPMAC